MNDLSGERTTYTARANFLTITRVYTDPSCTAPYTVDNMRDLILAVPTDFAIIITIKVFISKKLQN